MDSTDFSIKVQQKIVVNGAFEENGFEIKISELKRWLMGIGTHWTYNDIYEDTENGKMVAVQGFAYGDVARAFFLKKDARRKWKTLIKSLKW